MRENLRARLSAQSQVHRCKDPAFRNAEADLLVRHHLQEMEDPAVETGTARIDASDWVQRLAHQSPQQTGGVQRQDLERRVATDQIEKAELQTGAIKPTWLRYPEEARQGIETEPRGVLIVRRQWSYNVSLRAVTRRSRSRQRRREIT